MIKVHFLKRRRRKEAKKDLPTWWPMEGSKLGGPWNVSSLVGLRRNPMFRGQWGNIFARWPMEGSKFGYLWKEKYKHLFHLLPLFTPKDFT
jgi:hypothetical protein